MHPGKTIAACYAIVTLATVLHFREIKPLLADIRLPAAGEAQVFLPDVRTALAGLRANNVTRFNLLGLFSTDQRHRQGLIDAAFPLRFDAASPLFVGYRDEATGNNLRIVWEKDDVVIAVAAQ